MVGLLVCVLITLIWLSNEKKVLVAIVAVGFGLSAALVAEGIRGIIQVKTKLLSASGPLLIFLVTWWSVMATGAPEALPDIRSLLGALRHGK
jgi:hypothetical protein